MPRPRFARPRHETRIAWLALAGGAPALLVALVAVWSVPNRASLRLTLTILTVGAWLMCALALRRHGDAALLALALAMFGAAPLAAAPASSPPGARRYT